MLNFHKTCCVCCKHNSCTSFMFCLVGNGEAFSAFAQSSQSPRCTTVCRMLAFVLTKISSRLLISSFFSRRFFHVLFHEPDHEMSLFEHFLSFRWLRLPPITVGSITLLIAATIKDHMFARIEGSWDNINLCDFNK